MSSNFIKTTNNSATLGGGITVSNGVSTVPTPTTTDNSTTIATTEFVKSQGYITSSALGSTYATLASPAFTGTPTLTSALLTSDSSTTLATTAFVKNQNYVDNYSTQAIDGNKSFINNVTGYGGLLLTGTNEGNFYHSRTLITDTTNDTWVKLVQILQSANSCALTVRGTYTNTDDYIAFEAVIHFQGTGTKALTAKVKTTNIVPTSVYTTVTNSNFWGTYFDLVLVTDTFAYTSTLYAKVKTGSLTRRLLNMDITCTNKSLSSNTARLIYFGTTYLFSFSGVMSNAVDSTLNTTSVDNWVVSTNAYNEYNSNNSNQIGIGTTPVCTLDVNGAIRSNSCIDTLQPCAWTAVTFDFNTGANWWFNSGTAATQTPATLTFNNLTATSGQSYNFTFILPNTNTAYYINPTAVKVGTTTATFKSNIGTLSTASNFIIQTFTCMYLGTTWYVLTSATSF